MGNEFRCPVCGAAVNSSGGPLSSEWAVALHVSGKVRSSDRLHKAWVRQKIGVTSAPSINDLAEMIVLVVHEELQRTADTQDERSEPKPLDFVHRVELLLHGHVKGRLRSKFGDEGETWWVKGVPQSICEDCAKRREGDAKRDDLYQYTYLIDLKSILEKN
jgi:hypothetical protein